MRKLFTILILLLALKTIAQVTPTNSMPAGTTPATSIQYQVKSIDGILEYWGYDSKNNATRLFYTGEGINYYFLSKNSAAATYATKNGTTAQYIRGDGSFSTFPTNVSSFNNDANYISRTGISASGSINYNSTTGVFSYTQPTNVSAFTNDAGYLTSSYTGFDTRYLALHATADNSNQLGGVNASGYGQLGANQTWTLSNNFAGTTFVPNISAGANDARAANTSYVDNAIAAFRAANNSFSGINSVPTPGTNTPSSGQIVNQQWVNNYFSPIASPQFTGQFRVQGSNIGVTGIPNLNSASGNILGVFRNLLNGPDETDLVSYPGSVTGSFGGFLGSVYNNGAGSSGGRKDLFYSNGSNGDFTVYGRFTPTQIDHAVTTPSRFAVYDATNTLQYRTASELLSDIGGSSGGGGSGLTNPMTAPEDIIKGSTGGTPARLPVGSNGQVLGITSGSVGWITPSSSSGEPAGGAFYRKFRRIINSNYTIQSDDFCVVETATTGNYTFTLPSLFYTSGTGNDGRVLILKCPGVSTGNLNVTVNSGDDGFDGVIGNYTITLTPGQTLQIIGSSIGGANPRMWYTLK